MNRLIQAIENTQSKVDGLRKRALKETPTRTIVIDPLLEALGWDVRDPDEVELEYPTIDGKSVDYALKLNKKCVLLVEAKPLDDALNDVKAITQVVSYAGNDGIMWCALTNGLKWKVYRSVENCPAPEKLMYEVTLDPHDSEGMSVLQVAQQLWRLSREEMAKGTLDALGEQIFTDGKVRKVLATIMRDPPRSLLNMIRNELGDKHFVPRRIKESLLRVSSELTGPVPAEGSMPVLQSAAEASTSVSISTRKQSVSRIARKRQAHTAYDEMHHIIGKPQEVVVLYQAIDRLCHSLDPETITKRYLAKCIAYDGVKRSFCSVRIQQGGLRVWLKLKYSRLINAPAFVRDVSNVGHWGAGDVELNITSLSQIEESTVLIRQSYEESGR